MVCRQQRADRDHQGIVYPVAAPVRRLSNRFVDLDR
jgi:hypothetical protein